MKNVSCLLLVLLVAGTTFAVSLQSELGIADLEHRWTFNGTMDDDAAAIGANKGAAAFTGPDLSKGVLNATHATITNNPAGDTWGQTQNCSIALPSYIIRDSAFSAKTIELWVRDINAEGWQNGLFYLGDGKDGEWGGHPMLRATSRENDKTTVAWFQSQQNPGGGYTQRQFQPNVGDDKAHQLAIVTAADNSWVEIYYDGALKAAWAGVPWEGPGLDQSHNFNDSRNRIGALDDRTWDARWLTGEIYDFRIWGREMSSADILKSYNLGSEVATIVPEPATLGLLGLGAMSLLRRRK